MGSVIRKRIRNILEIPQDILVELIGRGIILNREILPVSLEVHIGKGLTFNNEGGLEIDTGKGLGFDINDKLEVSLGRGLEVDERGQVSIKYGFGLTCDEQCGVSIDLQPDPTKETSFITQTNSSLTQEGAKVVLTKTFTEQKTLRNQSGVILDIVTGSSFEVKDEVILTDHTYGGYGGYCGYGLSLLSKPSSSKNPNFYAK